MGEILIALERVSEAKEMFNKAISLNPKFLKVRKILKELPND